MSAARDAVAREPCRNPAGRERRQVNFVAELQGKVSELRVSTLGVVARVSTPSDLHQIYLQPHGSNTTVLQTSDNVRPHHGSRGGTHSNPH